MAHFAELDDNNKVLRVVVVDDNEVGENGSLQGEQYCQNLFGGNWKQTSYSTRGGVHYTFSGENPNKTITVSEDQSKAFRWHYASTGYTYYPDRDAFISDKPYPSWILNENTCQWEAPVAIPTDQLESDQWYEWNEENNSWIIKTKTI